jgi:hypothetical protein
MDEQETFQRLTISSPGSRILFAVGFIALVGVGIWFAVYASRFVPAVVNRISTAAVALSTTFMPGPASLVVVPNGSTTIPFDTLTVNAPSTPSIGEVAAPETQMDSTAPVATPSPVKTAPPAAGPKTSTTYPQSGELVVTTATSSSGFPDLTTAIVAAGYLSGASTDSFIATTTVPAGSRPAVKFFIVNSGSGTVASGWRFSASLPTQSAYIFYSDPQQALNPGDSIEYTLGFDQASPGNQTISITANSDHISSESNPNNNSASANLTIKGS